jgi:proline iminopeptidase
MTEVKTGGVTMLPIEGGKYRVWTKRVGTGPIQMLTLHGGPGCTHEYMECFEDFLPQRGIQFYHYDQLGSHYSDQPDDTSLWRVARFCDEVEQVRATLGLENFYLFGHSWGGMLGIEYALKYQHHLRGLVISNMTASIASYVESINQIRRQLPAEDLRILENYEAKGEYNAPEYEQVMLQRVYARCICRLNPWPEPLTRMFRHMNFQVYNTMQGPNEFVVNGNFKDWDRWEDLPRIKIPTLLLGARHDTMSLDDIRRMGELIPKSRVAICEHGSHLAMYDDQEAYFRYLIDFLLDVDAGRPL